MQGNCSSKYEKTDRPTENAENAADDLSQDPPIGSQPVPELSGYFPGPWKVIGPHFGRWSVRQDPEDWDGLGYQHICQLPAEKKGTHYGEAFRATAELIAAAPDLARRVSELEAERDALRERVTQLQEDAEMACITPADDCDCSGCSYAAARAEGGAA